MNAIYLGTGRALKPNTPSCYSTEYRATFWEINGEQYQSFCKAVDNFDLVTGHTYEIIATINGRTLQRARFA